MSDESPPNLNPPDSESSAAGGRPKREGNESLWKRARRTLGTSQLTFLQPQNRPADAPTSAPGSGPAAPNKRREQVRHAQRTHRQRTQNYIKTLESEVVRLREAEMKAVEERDKLQAQIRSLKSLIAAANLSLPPDLEDPIDSATDPIIPDFNFDMPAQVSYSTDDLQHDRLHVRWPNQSSPQVQMSPAALAHLQTQRNYPSSVEPYDFRAMTEDLPNDATTAAFDPLSASTDAPPPFHGSPPQQQPAFHDAYATETKQAHMLNILETAVDFVLALEAPCMQHIPYPADLSGNDDPANHVMMMSTPLVAFAPQAPQPNMNWTASGAIIKELLNLSSSINLEGELTPVAAWHQLHQHPDFWRLDKEAIETLKRELSTLSNCYGFGAVVDEHVFRSSLNRLVTAAKKRGG